MEEDFKKEITLNNSQQNDTDNEEKHNVWFSIKNKLKSFFNTRPTKHELYQAKIISSIDDPILVIPLKLNIFLIVCKEILKGFFNNFVIFLNSQIFFFITDLNELGLFRMSGDSKNSTKLWSSFIFDNPSIEDEPIHDITSKTYKLFQYFSY